MKVGKINIPDYKFPSNIEKELLRYLEESEERLSYLAEVGLDYPLNDLSVDKEILRLYATICFYKENPTYGWAAINIALAFDCLGELDYAIDVLNSIENANGISLYSKRFEDPMFLAGFWLADNKRFEEALSYYNKSLAKKLIAEKGSINVHIGTIYHEQQLFKEAMKFYKTAILEFQKEDDDTKFIDEQIVGLNNLLKSTQTEKKISEYFRTNHGIQQINNIT